MAKKPLDYYKKEITLQDLKPGDILIFKGDKSFASQKIMQLTDSMVSHSALYFQDDPIKALADSGEKGLHAHAIGTEKNTRQIYVSRIKDSETGKFFSDSALYPVLHVAKGYIDQDLRYPYGDLLALALLILFGKVSPSVFDLGKITKALIALFKVLIDETIYHGQHPMVCSSFVYQCYQDAANGNGDPSKANKKLKLHIENGDIKSVKQGALTQENDVQTLFDWYAQHAINNNLDSQVLAELEEDEAEEKLTKEQIEALFEDAFLENGKESVAFSAAFPKISDMNPLVKKILKLVAKFLKIPGEKISELIEKLRDMQSLFVTPNDLGFNVTNTEKIGYLSIERKDDNLEGDQITTKYNKEP